MCFHKDQEILSSWREFFHTPRAEQVVKGVREEESEHATHSFKSK